jgi:hypothetical protein
MSEITGYLERVSFFNDAPVNFVIIIFFLETYRNFIFTVDPQQTAK